VLRSMLAVGPTPQSNVIAIDVFARNPQKGQEILGVLVDAYLDRHAQVHRATGAAEFFEHELGLQRQRVQAAEGKLSEFVERERIVVPEDQIRWAVKDAVRYRDVLRTQSNKISVAERNLEIMKKQLADQPERIFADSERIGLRGELPLATFGGLKARGHPVGASGCYQIVEAVLQLSERAGENQVPGAGVALVQNIGGTGATVVSHVLTRED